MGGGEGGGERGGGEGRGGGCLVMRRVESRTSAATCRAHQCWRLGIKLNRERGKEREREGGRERGMLVGWLLNVPATC